MPPSSAPSSLLPDMISPGEPISRSRWITGSNMARPAPPADRARMTCSPTSRAWGRNSLSAKSGFLVPDTRS